ncbi:11977_t:CDS:1, partial [Ambispora leptoticha]
LEFLVLRALWIVSKDLYQGVERQTHDQTSCSEVVLIAAFAATFYMSKNFMMGMQSRE